MTDQFNLRVFTSDRFTIDHSSECRIPGYLVVRTRGPATSLAELPEEDAGALGELLARATRAIERVTAAERVYCLVFAELDRRLHVHLFPRTAWLLEEYRDATDSGARPVNGPLLFEWARTRYAGPADPPPQAGSIPDACQALRSCLRM